MIKDFPKDFPLGKEVLNLDCTETAIEGLETKHFQFGEAPILT